MPLKYTILILWVLLSAPALGAEAITRIWLTHQTADVSTLTVNWETDAPGPSRVEFGPSASLGRSASGDGTATLHQVEIPFPDSGTLHYRVATGERQSAVHAVKTYSGDSLRIAATANWYLQPPLDALAADDPHLLLSCGDKVIATLEVDGSPSPNTASFSQFVGRYPELFARVPFLPALGNHDRQVRPPDTDNPELPLYDLEARAFRAFFPLPGDGRFYHVDIPGFDVRLAALDVSHARDIGTPRQSCLPLDRASAQFRWYRDLTRSRTQRFMLTFHNERNGFMRSLERGEWETLFRQNSAILSGFGSYAERAEVKGTPYFNAALKEKDAYGDRRYLKFYEATPSYLLLHIPREGETMAVELKRTDGTLLDRSEWPGRARMGDRR